MKKEMVKIENLKETSRTEDSFKVDRGYITKEYKINSADTFQKNWDSSYLLREGIIGCFVI